MTLTGQKLLKSNKLIIVVLPGSHLNTLNTEENVAIWGKKFSICVIPAQEVNVIRIIHVYYIQLACASIAHISTSSIEQKNNSPLLFTV